MKEKENNFFLSHYFGFCHLQLFLILASTDALEKLSSKLLTDLKILCLFFTSLTGF